MQIGIADRGGGLDAELTCRPTRQIGRSIEPVVRVELVAEDEADVRAGPGDFQIKVGHDGKPTGGDVEADRR